MGKGTDKRQEFIDDIVRKTLAGMMGDCDVRHASHTVADGMAHLANECDIDEISPGEVDDYTRELVNAYVGFVVAPNHEVYGSNADYCSEHALGSVSGYRLRLRDTEVADGILHDIRVGIHATAIQPRRAFWALSKAKVPISRKRKAAVR